MQLIKVSSIKNYDFRTMQLSPPVVVAFMLPIDTLPSPPFLPTFNVKLQFKFLDNDSYTESKMVNSGLHLLSAVKALTPSTATNFYDRADRPLLSLDSATLPRILKLTAFPPANSLRKQRSLSRK
jgi:hypothetical protein